VVTRLQGSYSRQPIQTPRRNTYQTPPQQDQTPAAVDTSEDYE